jgi:hypothetical protein
MGEKKIVVPTGMLKAAMNSIQPSVLVGTISVSLKAALLWLSENPPVPTFRTVDECGSAGMCSADGLDGEFCRTKDVIEWQRLMFVAPEPEVLEEIKDLMLSQQSHPKLEGFKDELNLRMIEAFRRGQKAKEK